MVSWGAEVGVFESGTDCSFVRNGEKCQENKIDDFSQHINWRAVRGGLETAPICAIDSNVSQNDVCLLLGVGFPTSTSFWRSAKNFRTLFENVTVSTDIRT